MSIEVLALVNYYARSGFYRHVQTVCNEVLKKRGGQDPTLTFWRALGVLREGAVSDAIRELEGVASRGDMQLMLPVLPLHHPLTLSPLLRACAPRGPRHRGAQVKIMQLHANLMSRVVDQEEVARLQVVILPI